MKHTTENIWWHSQRLGKTWRDGRAWLHFGEGASRSIGLEWHFFKFKCAAWVILGGVEEEINISIAIPWLITLYLSFENFIDEKYLPHTVEDSMNTPGKTFIMPRPRQIGFRVFDGAIWISLWEDIHQSSTKDPWWWSFNWRPAVLMDREDRVVANSEV